MTLQNAIYNRISQLCDERNITIDDLSAISDVSMSSIGALARGDHKTIRLSTVEKICAGLHISLADFFCCDTFRGLKHS